VRLREEGRSYVDIAELLSVGVATVSRILRLHREKGSVEPARPGGGNFSPLRGKTADKLRVFIDESFCKTGMRREYARSPRGERAIGSRPFRDWKTISVDGDAFYSYVTRRLVPWLKPGDVVVMDNLNMHKMVRVREAIAAAGAQAIYLPTYSPELNPIEMLWADLKRSLRKLAINDQSELRRAVRRLSRQVPLAKIDGWFRHALAYTRIN
jgi:transposase